MVVGMTGGKLCPYPIFGHNAASASSKVATAEMGAVVVAGTMVVAIKEISTKATTNGIVVTMIQ